MYKYKDPKSYLQHKDGHKYIEKIIVNGKARYFYTMEELQAYKNALSSNDEMGRLAAATENKNSKQGHKDQIDKGQKVLDDQKRQLAELKNKKFKTKKTKEAEKELEKAIEKNSAYLNEQKKARDDFDKATKDYQDSRTLKGKAQDLKEAYQKYHPKKSSSSSSRTTQDYVSKGKAYVENAVKGAKKKKDDVTNNIKKKKRQKQQVTHGSKNKMKDR